MKLLITTQAVDLDDPVLGFMHRWIAEFAKRCESVHVVCLKEGRHELPLNVFVHSLGKEQLAVGSWQLAVRVKYIARFYRYIWRYRKEYDAVFVHMNSEYVVLGGILWHSWGKRVVLWRNHKLEGLSTSVAARLATIVCYTSPAAFVAKFRNAVQMPIGIDTDFFSPAGDAKPRSILFIGRLDPVKRVDVFIRSLEKLQEQNVEFTADIVGDPTDVASTYAHDVRNLGAVLCLDGLLTMRPGVTNEQARDLFRSHSVYCNLTPSGSFDKTIGEAMACGAIAVVQNDALRGVLPEKLVVTSDSAEDAANSMRSALELPENERRTIAETSRAYVVREHSLSLLADKLMRVLSAS
jgi:glycosyltransferase involved in cell wall biosynthesis